MKLQAKLIEKTAPVSGTSNNGSWTKQDIVVETDGEYKKQVCFSVWGNKIDLGQFKLNETIDISFELQSRCYNNKWYTEARAWRIDKLVNEPNFDNSLNNSKNIINEMNDDDDDELPF